KKIFLLGSNEIGAIDSEQRLALADIVVGSIDENLANPSGKAYLYRSQPPLIHLNIAGDSNFVADSLYLGRVELHPYVLHSLWRELNRNQRKLRWRSGVWIGIVFACTAVFAGGRG